MSVLLTAGFRWSRRFATAPRPRNDRNRLAAIQSAKHLRRETFGGFGFLWRLPGVFANLLAGY